MRNVLFEFPLHCSIGSTVRSAAPITSVIIKRLNFTYPWILNISHLSLERYYCTGRIREASRYLGRNFHAVVLSHISAGGPQRVTSARLQKLDSSFSVCDMDFTSRS